MEKTLFEQAGVKYREVDGLLYPMLPADTAKVSADVGKYGRLWMHLLFKVDRQSYNRKLFAGTIVDEALIKNENAYEMIDKATEEYLKRLGTDKKHSSIEIWKCRTAAVITREELFLESAFRDMERIKSELGENLNQHIESEE